MTAKAQTTTKGGQPPNANEDEQAAAAILALLNSPGMPEFMIETVSDADSGEFVPAALATLIALSHGRDIRPGESDLADLLSAVLKHPDTPTDLERAMKDHVCEWIDDSNTFGPEFLRLVLAQGKGIGTEGPTGGAVDEGQGEGVQAPATARPKIAWRRVEEIVAVLVPPDGDKEAHALSELIAAVAYEEERGERDRVAVTAIGAAYRRTMACSDAEKSFTADIPYIR